MAKVCVVSSSQNQSLERWLYDHGDRRPRHHDHHHHHHHPNRLRNARPVVRGFSQHFSSFNCKAAQCALQTSQGMLLLEFRDPLAWPNFFALTPNSVHIPNTATEQLLENDLGLHRASGHSSGFMLLTCHVFAQALVDKLWTPSLVLVQVQEPAQGAQVNCKAEVTTSGCLRES